MRKNQTIYSIGHSNHSMDYFLELLQSQQINCVVDVRSTPASSYNPQFNQAPLRACLKKQGINYMHFAEEFGARQETAEVLDQAGKVHFGLVQKTPAFQRGVERIEKGLEKGFIITLMCSEGEPLDCHRFSMVSNYLDNKGIAVVHILKDKTLLTHQELEQKLLKKYAKKIPQPSLFEPNIDATVQLLAAYRLHNQDIAWKKESDEL